jgi:hypothetical protein
MVDFMVLLYFIMIWRGRMAGIGLRRSFDYEKIDYDGDGNGNGDGDGNVLF